MKIKDFIYKNILPVLGWLAINLISITLRIHTENEHIVDAIKNGEYAYLINTTEGRQAITDSVYIRREALLNKVTYTTTMNAAFATIRAKSADDRNKVASVQELHARLKH